MSFVLNSFSKKSPQEAANANANKEADEAKEGKRNRGAKTHPLLSSRTDPYVDDQDLYKPKISRKERLAYWEELVKQNKRIRQKVDVSWLTESEEFGEEIQHYPYRLVLLSVFLTHNFWDHLYINLFLVFFLLIIFYQDGFAAQYAPFLIGMNAGNQLLLVPFILMFLGQLVPLFGTLYLMHNCRDLMILMASVKITRWSVIAALLAQYIEYFHYGGQDKAHLAGTCRKGTYKPIFSKENYRRVVELIKKISSKYARVKPIEGGTEEENNEEENEEDEDDGGNAIEEGNEQEEEEVQGAGGEEEGKEGEDGGGPKEELLEWHCIVCNFVNKKEPTRNPDVTLAFFTRGKLYAAPYVKILWSSKTAICSKCFTPYDYKPPQGSAHLFPFHPTPHIAYHKYPYQLRVQNGLKKDKWSLRRNALYAFFYGISNHMESATLRNDWKLRKYVANEFRPIPRYHLKKHGKVKEFYQVGEIVECKQQKFDFQRCRILKMHPRNATYDIIYDPGDELRFVNEHHLRSRPEKGAFAYRIELAMIIIIFTLPMCFMMAINTMNFGLVFLTSMLISLILFCVRLFGVMQLIMNNPDAGIVVILKANVITLLPLFMTMISTIIGVQNGGIPTQWISIGVVFLLTQLMALPALYIYRPPFAVIGLIVCMLSTAGFLLLAVTIGLGVTLPYMAITLAPWILLLVFFKYLRSVLHTIWDVCLIIRPASDLSEHNPSLALYLWKEWKRLTKKTEEVKPPTEGGGDEQENA